MIVGNASNVKMNTIQLIVRNASNVEMNTTQLELTTKRSNPNKDSINSLYSLIILTEPGNSWGIDTGMPMPTKNDTALH